MSRCLKADTPDFTDQPVTRLTTDRTAPTTSNARNWYRTRSNGKGGRAQTLFVPAPPKAALVPLLAAETLVSVASP